MGGRFRPKNPLPKSSIRLNGPESPKRYVPTEPFNASLGTVPKERTRHRDREQRPRRAGSRGSPPAPRDRKVLRTANRAQRRTGSRRRASPPHEVERYED